MDFSQLAEAIKVRGKELGFQGSALPTPRLIWRNPGMGCGNGWAKAIMAKWIIWRNTDPVALALKNSFPARCG